LSSTRLNEHLLRATQTMRRSTFHRSMTCRTCPTYRRLPAMAMRRLPSPRKPSRKQTNRPAKNLKARTSPILLSFPAFVKPRPPPHQPQTTNRRLLFRTSNLTTNPPKKHRRRPIFLWRCQVATILRYPLPFQAADRPPTRRRLPRPMTKENTAAPETSGEDAVDISSMLQPSGAGKTDGEPKGGKSDDLDDEMRRLLGEIAGDPEQK
jgi:hypothetical protein